MSDNKHILAKIHAVMCDVGYIQKDKKNQHHGYSYASELAIKQALGQAFRDRGIVFQLETSDASTLPVELGKYDKQGDIRMATVIQARYTFHDIESGESLSGTFVSSGPARDDKGLWAATTNAIKYILTSTFLIPTGDDAESDTNHPAPSNNTPAPKEKPASKPAKNDTPKAALGMALKERASALNLKSPMHEILRQVCMSNAGVQGAKAHGTNQDAMILCIGNKKTPHDAAEWSAMHCAMALLTDEQMVKIDGAAALEMEGGQ